MSSAICFNSDQSKILSSGNGWVKAIEISLKLFAIQPITTQYHILTHCRYIAVENIMRKGEIVSNISFSHIVFYPLRYLLSILNAL